MPIAFAHRGARAELPENTLPAFARALELGATGLESDAWVTADGVAVLDHDGVVSQGWRRVPIAGLTRPQLPGHIPSLAELYRSCGTGFELSLDLKDPAALEPVVAAAAAAGATARLWLCHHDWRLLAAWRGETGEAQLVHSTRRRDMVEGPGRRAAVLAGAGLAAINLRAREWTGAAVAAVHQHGLAAFGWDAQSEDALRRAVLLGLDGVYCDHVARMVSCLAEA